MNSITDTDRTDTAVQLLPVTNPIENVCQQNLFVREDYAKRAQHDIMMCLAPNILKSRTSRVHLRSLEIESTQANISHVTFSF